MGKLQKCFSPPDDVSVDAYRLSAARWVGLAMAACPDDVPWQRVVNSQGKISHPEAGKQKKLLEEEGVSFTKDKLDLSEYQWLVSEKNDQPKQGRLF